MRNPFLFATEGTEINLKSKNLNAKFMIFNLIYLSRLCTTNVQILEILLSKFENLPPHPALSPLWGERMKVRGADGFWLRLCRAVISVA